MMKKKLLFLFFFTSLFGFQQVEVKNSFEDYFEGKSTIYYYDELKQSHVYPNNWDFNGDGRKDTIKFIGNGGAHLMYKPYLVLDSSCTISLDFLIEMPLWEATDSLKIEKHCSSIFFTTGDFNKDGITDVFLNTYFEDRKKMIVLSFSSGCNYDITEFKTMDSTPPR